MRLEEFFTGNLNAGPASIDGGLPIPVTPAYGEDKYTKTDKGKKRVYEPKDTQDTEEQFATVKPSENDSDASEDSAEDNGDKDIAGDESDLLPNASDYGLGLNDLALLARLLKDY